jgi:hypothetical protein
MSFNDPRCKAYCPRIEIALWTILIGAVVGLWGYSAYRFWEAL